MDELDRVYDSGIDYVMTPTASGYAPRLMELMDENYTREHSDDYYTQTANLAGTS